MLKMSHDCGVQPTSFKYKKGEIESSFQFSSPREAAEFPKGAGHPPLPADESGLGPLKRIWVVCAPSDSRRICSGFLRDWDRGERQVLLCCKCHHRRLRLEIPTIGQL